MIWMGVMAAALSAGPGQGLATVQCRVGADHRLRACVVLSESPPGANVGAFALKLVKASRPQPNDPRIRNGRITVTMKFKLPSP